MRFALAAALFVLAAIPYGAAAADPAETALLRDDLRALSQLIRTTHPAPFHAIAEAAFDREVADLDARIPALSRDRVVLEFQRIVASVGDGHTSVRLFATHGAGGENGFASYPVRFYRFSDGWFVRSGDDRYAAIRGGRIVSIAGLAPDALAERLAPYVSHDNAMTVLDRVPFFMASPNVMRALDLAGADGAVPIVVSAGGKTVSATLDTSGPAGELRSMRDPGAPVPLWERHPERAFWYDYDAATQLLYIGYNQVTDTPEQTARAFFDEVFAFAQSHPVARCVIDLRTNGGGNGFLNKPLILDLVRSRQLDRDGVVFAVIGRSTFSAAQMAVSDLEKWTNVTFAGEPGGATPNHYGDARTTRLPNSGVSVSVSTVYWQTSTAFDHRDAVKPAIAAELSSSDERNGVDPVLRAIAAYVPLREALAPALKDADEAAIARIVRRYAADPMYKYANEFQVNRLGYDELGAKRMSTAIALFRANANAYPRSANAFDSLGEGLAAAGRTAEAIVAYRRALELAPDADKARLRAALAKLGAS
ncbi:MAG TPA: hypothetical protein VGX96_09220 [Candidatus Elarobacter sp.]|nr:hypothetical protein [Candidatus Elarobacter sp.]